MSSPKKPCGRVTGGLRARHSKSSPVAEEWAGERTARRPHPYYLSLSPTLLSMGQARASPPGRPQGSPPHIRIHPRPYYDHGVAPQGASCHSKGRRGGGVVRGHLRLPWGDVGPFTKSSPQSVSERAITCPPDRLRV